MRAAQPIIRVLLNLIGVTDNRQPGAGFQQSAPAGSARPRSLPRRGHASRPARRRRHRRRGGRTDRRRSLSVAARAISHFRPSRSCRRLVGNTRPRFGSGIITASAAIPSFSPTHSPHSISARSGDVLCSIDAAITSRPRSAFARGEAARRCREGSNPSLLSRPVAPVLDRARRVGSTM